MGDSGVAQAPGDGQAVHVRQHDVEDDEVGAWASWNAPLPSSAVTTASGKTQRGGEEVADVGFVVDDE